MRNCPHCNREIQDEAVICRFCRQDVEPPLWLTSLQKCPFCAEWIERGIDRCPLCSKDVSGVLQTGMLGAAEEEGESLLSRITRQSEPETQAEEPPDIASDVAPPPPQDVPRESVFDAPDPQPFEDAGLAALHERRLNPDDEFDPLADLRPAIEVEELETESPSFFSSNIAKIAVGVFGAAIIIFLAFFILRNIDISAIGSSENDQTPQSSETKITEGSPTNDENAASTETTSAGVLLATETPELECFIWDQITLAQSGQTLCATGELKRWFRVNASMPYLAIFSEDTGTFAIADRTQTYSEFGPGDCVRIEGVVEVMRGVRPFIDAQGALEACD
ncbi:MAG: hypothetical protein ACERKX_04485 [Anaerolineales bacterium]